MAGVEGEVHVGVGTAADEVPGEGEEERGSGLRLPISRIKRIMKADPDFCLASQDAVFLVTKATELFLESLAQEAYHFTCQARRKTVSRRDLDNSIETIEALAFLDGAID